MQIEFLGSGGAVTTPRPHCTCPVCAEARIKGIPYSRSGPGVFVHGPNVLIDTAEEIKAQLNRSQVTHIDACFYSHWHPDHVMGMRVWETRNADFGHWPANHACTDIYLPQQVAVDFHNFLGAWNQFEFMQRHGWVKVHVLNDGDVVTVNGTPIRPFRVAQDYVYAFVFEGEGQRVLIAPDELYQWDPPDDVHGMDMVVLPMGITEFHPLTGERLIDEAHPVLNAEATFRQTLGMVRKLAAKRVIMTHLEEISGMNYDDYIRLEFKLRQDGYNITFAYDTLVVSI
ncbi:MAG: hypothetical protein JW966_02585 [Anaerolineae bacterium]|nr:hypothetical protein [Anaerolineae bacterium]